MAFKNRIDEILNVLSVRNVFNENGSIVPWSSTVWKDVVNELNRYLLII